MTRTTSMQAKKAQLTREQIDAAIAGLEAACNIILVAIKILKALR